MRWVMGCLAFAVVSWATMGHAQPRAEEQSPASSTATPCDDMYAHVLGAMREGKYLDDKLISTSTPKCLEWLDTQQQFPVAIQQPLEALARRSRSAPSHEEDVAAAALCSLMPVFGFELIERLLRSESLSSPTYGTCRGALALKPVLMARNDDEAGQALARLYHVDSLDWVRLVKWQPRIRRVSGPLLLTMKERRSGYFDELRGHLCLPTPAPTLVSACASTENTAESDWQVKHSLDTRTEQRLQVLTKFGIATGVIGGLSGLAYLDRNGPGGQAIAIGSGAALGATLGIGAALAAGENAFHRGVLAIPLALVGAVGGGVITGLTSDKRGDARFASAAVPLAGIWLISLGLTIDAL